MAQSQPTRLLTTRLRTGLAVTLTAFVFGQAVREVLNPSKTPSGWLFPVDFVLHGWALVAVNVFFYGYLWWLGYWFTRGTHGRERVFVVGWFVGILLWPLKTLPHGWVLAIRYVSAFGLAVALVAAVFFLIRPPQQPTAEQTEQHI